MSFITTRLFPQTEEDLAEFYAHHSEQYNHHAFCLNPGFQNSPWVQAYHAFWQQYHQNQMEKHRGVYFGL